MTTSDVHYSSASNEWSTPQDFYDNLNDEFDFDLDPCATKENTKCSTFFTKEDNGLTRSWEGHRVFCNPPYGSQIKHWVKKCFDENRDNNTFIVLLIPARTDTRYFHDYVYQKENVDIRFIKGRLKFGDCENSAPFPSMVVIYKQRI